MRSCRELLSVHENLEVICFLPANHNHRLKMFFKNQECLNYKFCALFCPRALKSFSRAVDISDFGP
jgi:Pyruvate/2-oxoacid:ferredoxin oxidoreductase delta subunit